MPKKTFLLINYYEKNRTGNLRYDEQSRQILKDQLIAVRIKKHNDFLSLQNSTNKKATRHYAILCGGSMISSIDSNGISSRENCVSVASQEPHQKIC